MKHKTRSVFQNFNACNRKVLEKYFINFIICIKPNKSKLKLNIPRPVSNFILSGIKWILKNFALTFCFSNRKLRIYKILTTTYRKQESLNKVVIIQRPQNHQVGTFVSVAVPYSSVPQIYKLLY